MANKRDVELALRATDLATKTYTDVIGAVDKLTASLAKQMDAAKSGGVTVGELQGTLEKLRQVSADLARDNTLVERYKASAAALENAEKRAAGASQKFLDLKAAADASGKSSAAQARDINRAEVAATRAALALDKARLKSAEYGAQLKAIGIETSELAAVDANFIAQFERLGGAINSARGAITEYAANRRVFKEEQAAEAAQAEALRQKEQAGVAAYNAFLAEQDAARAAKSAQVGQAITAEKARNDAAYVAMYSSLLNQRSTREEESAAAYTSFLAEQEAVRAAKSRQIGDALQAEKTFRDQEYVAMYAGLLEKQTTAERAAAKAATDGYKEQEAAAAALTARKEAMAKAELAAAQKFAAEQKAVQDKFYVADWERLLAQRDADSEAYYKREKSRLAEYDAVVRKYLTEENGLKESQHNKPASGSGGTGFSQQRVFLGLKPYELQDIAYRVNDVFVQLAAGQTLTESLAVQGFKAFKIFDGELGNLLGLLPQLAAGAGVLGVLAIALLRVQQNAEAIRAYNRELAVSVDGAKYNAQALVEQQRALELIGIGFKDAGAAFHEFMKIGADQSQLPALTKQAWDLSRVFGISVPEAAKKLAESFSGGIKEIVALNSEYNFLTLSQFKAIEGLYDAGKAAQAQAMAQDILADKVHKAAEAFEGPWTKALREARNAAVEFFDLLANGELGRELLNLTEHLAKALQDFVGGVKWLADKFPGMGGSANSTTVSDLEDERSGVKTQRDLVKRQRAAIEAYPAGADRDLALEDANNQLADLEAKYIKLTNTIDAAKDAQEKQTAAAKKTGDAVSETTARQIAGEEAVHRLRIQYERERRTDREGQIKSAGEEEYQNVLDQTKDKGAADQARKMAEDQERYKLAEQDRRQAVRLIDELEASGSQALKSSKDDLNSQLKAVDETYDKIYLKLNEFERRGGGNILGMTPAAFRSALEQNKELIKDQTTIAFYDKQITDIQKERDEVEKSVMARLHDGAISASEAYAQLLASNNKLEPRMKSLAKSALDFADNLKKIRPSPSLDAFAGRMQRAETGPSSSGGDATSISKEELKQGNDLLKERNDLAKQFQDLADAGVISQRDANKQIAAVYADMKKQILDATDALIAFMNAAGQKGPAYQVALLRAEIAKLRGEAQEADPATKKLEENIRNIVTSDITNGFSKIADALGKWAVQGGKVGDLFKSIGEIATQMFADILKGIAEEILKTQILVEVQQVEKLLFHEGGVVGDLSNGVMSRSVNPGVFAGAPRYHSGTVVGLAPDEQAAILQKGEEVLTRGDPRNVLNGGRRGGSAGGGGAMQSLRQVLVLDPKDLAGAMNSSHGEKVVMTHLKANLPTVRTWLQGKG